MKLTLRDAARGRRRPCTFSAAALMPRSASELRLVLCCGASCTRSRRTASGAVPAAELHVPQARQRQASRSFNQLLGINNHGRSPGYFGSGAAGHPNKGYLLAPPYGRASYQRRELPRFGADPGHGAERPGRHASASSRRPTRPTLPRTRTSASTWSAAAGPPGGLPGSQGARRQVQPAGQPAARDQQRRRWRSASTLTRPATRTATGTASHPPVRADQAARRGEPHRERHQSTRTRSSGYFNPAAADGQGVLHHAGHRRPRCMSFALPWRRPDPGVRRQRSGEVVGAYTIGGQHVRFHLDREGPTSARSMTRTATAARSSTASTTRAPWSASTPARTATRTACSPGRSVLLAQKISGQCLADVQVEPVLGDRLGEHLVLELALPDQLSRAPPA